jgi:alpha-tubulin suppressor-like RCC1 family protein
MKKTVLIVSVMLLIQSTLKTNFALGESVLGGWGYRQGGNLISPLIVPVNDIIAIDAGMYTSAALKADGTIIVWGDNWYGQNNIPPNVRNGNVKAISIGSGFVLVLFANGTVTAWGSGTPEMLNPPSNLADVVEIAAGGNFSLARKSNGKVIAWGYNTSDGQLNVPENLNNAIRISAGIQHALAIRADGTVIAWGRDFNGSTVPPSGLRMVVDVAGGAAHSIALKSDGTVVAWGENQWGQTNVPTGLTNVVSIAAGEYHSVAVRKDGSVIGWGKDTEKQASGGSSLKGISKIAAGLDYTLVLGSGPFITSQPNSISVVENSKVVLKVEAVGVDPINYHWRFNSVPIAQSTNATLEIPNVSQLQAGTYSVEVSSPWGRIQSESVKIWVSAGNDSFATPKILDSIGGRFYSSIQNATKELGEPNHVDNSYGQSLWFSWTPRSSQNIVIDTVGSNFDSVLSVYTGEDLRNLRLVAADDDSGIINFTSRLRFYATANTTYKIAVDKSRIMAGPSFSGDGVVLNVNPESIQIGSPQIGSGGFKFKINSPSLGRVILQASSDLNKWVNIKTNFINDPGVFSFEDLGNPEAPALFYRVQPAQ